MSEQPQSGAQPAQYQQTAPYPQGYAYPPMMMVKPPVSGLRVTAGIIAFVLGIYNLLITFMMGSMPSGSVESGPFTGLIGVLMGASFLGAIIGGILVLVQMRSASKSGPITLLVFAGISLFGYVCLFGLTPWSKIVPLLGFLLAAVVAGLLIADLVRKPGAKAPVQGLLP